jgi:two-component system sensor histidine kinase SenX3
VSDDGGAKVIVTDMGEGFDETFVSRAFDSFSRSDEARARNTGGAGLGLAIAKGLIESLGGEIWAEPGPGGCVGFSLPRDARGV